MLGWSFLKLTVRLVWAESAPLRSRLEKEIANYRPATVNTNPTTNFWTVYKKVADEHDNDMISKCVGDLDTSLRFVRASVSLARLVILNRILFLC